MIDFSGAVCDGSTLLGLVAESIWVPDYATGTYLLIYCPVGYIVERTNTVQEQECTAWTAVTYVQASIVISVSLQAFTSMRQMAFVRAVAMASQILQNDVMIFSVNSEPAGQGRRSSVESIVVICRIVAANVSAGSYIISRLQSSALNENLIMQNFGSGVLTSANFVDSIITGKGGLDVQSIAAICAAAFVVFVLFLLFGYFFLRVFRRHWAKKKLLAAVQSARAGDTATLSHLPFRLHRDFAPIKVLGKGAFGLVVKAERSKDGMLVAIKIITPDRGIFRDQDMRQLNREEQVLQIYTSCRCEHAVNLAGVGMSKIKPSICWFITEFLMGDDMDTVVKCPDRGPVDDKECIVIARSVLAALKVIHAEGIAHRDIKPANIMCCTDSRKDSQIGTGGKPSDRCTYKLIDFGTVLGVDETVATGSMLTLNSHRSMAAGTPPYMSPEMFLESEKVHYSTDIWSLGVTLFEITTGILPFQAANSMLWSVVIAGNLNERAPSVLDCLDGAKRASFSHSLAKVIGKALEKRAVARYQSVDEMHEAVYSCLVDVGEACYRSNLSNYTIQCLTSAVTNKRQTDEK